jgi:uncharacterized membrane protein
MRWYSLLTWALLFLCRVSLAAPVVGLGERDVDATLDQSENQDATTTAINNEAIQATTTATGTQLTVTAATGTTASTTTNSSTSTSASGHTSHSSAATTVPSLDGTGSSGSSTSGNDTQSAYAGGLPIKPEITPALGVGGFILLVLGAALALIGIRKQW